MADVKPGQVWADNDERSMGRTLRVDSVEDGKAVCTVLTNSNSVTAELERRASGAPWRLGEASPYARDMRGKTTRISLARFKATHTGYRLVRDTQYGVRYSADGPVFAFPSQADAEARLAADGRGIGVLVSHEYEPGTPNSTDWREVEATS